MAWRLADDLQLVSFNKCLIPVCQFLRTLATDNGLSEIDVPDHILTPRYCEDFVFPLPSQTLWGSFFFLPCTQDGETPVCFRYVIQPVESHVTNIFKPNPVESPEQQDWRHSTIGACFVGNMEKVIRNKRASVIWEAPSTKDFT